MKTETQKAILIALLAVVIFAVWLAQDLAYIVRDYRHALAWGPLRPGSTITNLQALGILGAGIFLTVFLPALVLLRRAALRQSGQILDYADRELRAGKLAPVFKQLEARTKQ